MKSLHSFQFERIGTKWEIDFYEFLPPDKYEQIQAQILRTIGDFESKYSRFIKTSFLSQLKYKTGIFNVGDEFISILKIYFDLNDLTQGKFTPLIGQTLEEAGYDADLSFQASQLSKLPPLKKAIKILGANNIEILTPVSLDFGGVGKGYIVDRISEFLSNSLQAFSINAGGDIYFYNKLNDEKLRVGLEHPGNFHKLIGLVELEGNSSICSSSGNRRSWGEFHHILDLDTGTSPGGIIATWVIAESTLIADTICTALFLISPDAFKDFDSKPEYFVINADYSLTYSKNFKAEVFQ